MDSLDTPSISVIIPVYNGGNTFRKCLSNLDLANPPPLEVIVVADGDTDGSWLVAQEFGATVIRLETSGGPAKARNLGARKARGDILFFLDADVTIYPDLFSRVAAVFHGSTKPDALIGSYDDAPGEPNFLSQYKNLFHHYTHQTSKEDAFTFWGACGAIRRSIFLELGGFDESYRTPCVEDIELGYRLKRAGYFIHLCKHIQVKHLKRWEPISLLKAEIFYRALPWAELILSDRSFNADLNLNYANRLSVVLTFTLIGAAVAGAVYHWLWWMSPVITLGLLIINLDVYRFFYHKRGLLFTLQVIPWHWLYFLYGGGAFAYGAFKHYLGRLHLPEQPLVGGAHKSK